MNIHHYVKRIRVTLTQDEIVEAIEQYIKKELIAKNNYNETLEQLEIFEPMESLVEIGNSEEIDFEIEISD